MYPFYQTQCIYDSTSLFVWHQVLYIWHHIHHIWPHIHCICVITPTLSMISQPLYAWYHTQCTCDIVSTIFMTSYSLCMTWQHCVWMTPHSEYVWHLLQCRWHHLHSITPTNSIYDVTSTSSMTSHTLYQTSHPLYLYDHILSTDITPNFEWHHIHSITPNHSIYDVT